MRPFNPDSSEREIRDAAAEWFARRDAGLTIAEKAELNCWLAEDVRHRAAFARLDEAWSRLSQLRHFRPSARVHPDRDLLATPGCARPFSFPAAWIGLAAAIAVCFWMAWWGSAKNSSVATRPSPVVYATVSGGYQRVVLQDGSVVDLNSNTELSVLFTQMERRVDLSRGEAHFTVAKDAAHPFRVTTAGVTVQAVGTAFSVKRALENVEVLVTAGTVRLDVPQAMANTVPPQPFMQAGWHAVIPVMDAKQPTVEKVSTDQIRGMLGWQSSRLVFVEMPLEEAVEQFNQRNALQIEIADPALRRMPIGGSFDAQNVEAFLRLLGSNGDFNVERPAPTRVVLRQNH
jgi:transmembrane sensor